jgi:DNA repair exonuclease SbcCD ATPase subunit
VELVFDNSLGKAGGQWASYAELSVKRVLERDGESAYYINNQHVRRRDVADVFLGTGLGGRGYAIIEQGTISRIIDAKPEELRVFLEEAAGVSRYRERRRETENRLSDARQNLARVDDIRLELERQIERLTSQAAVAAQFQQGQAIARPQLRLDHQHIPALGIGLQPVLRLRLRAGAAHAAGQLQIVQALAQRILQLNAAVNDEHAKTQDFLPLVKFI